MAKNFPKSMTDTKPRSRELRELRIERMPPNIHLDRIYSNSRKPTEKS